MERARIFWVGPLWIVAARHDEHGLVGGRRPDLMEVDALFDLVCLFRLIADAAIAFDLVDGDIGGEVVSHQHMFAGMIDAGMDRPLPQFDKVAMLREFTERRDPEGRKIVLVGRIPGHRRDANSARACRNVQVSPRRMRPCVLNVGR